MDKLLVTGIDIGQHGLKAVTLKLVGQQYTLLGYKEVPLADGLVEGNHTIKQEEFVQILKELKKDLPRFGNKVAISVPDSAVISKALQIEQGLDEQEQEFAIVQAFSHQSPFPVEDLHLDYVPADHLNRGAHGQSFQIFATRREVVDTRTEAMTKSGLDPVLVEMHSHGLGRVWQLAAKQFPNKAKYALVDIGENNSSFTMFAESGEFFHKEFVCGSTPPSTINGPLLEQTAADNQADSFAIQLAERIRRQLQLYTSINGSQDVKGIWLSGEGQDMPFIAEILTQRLSLQCDVLNPLSLFEMKVAKKKRRSVEWPHFTAAAGLAVSGIQWLGGDDAVSS